MKSKSQMLALFSVLMIVLACACNQPTQDAPKAKKAEMAQEAEESGVKTERHVFDGGYSVEVPPGAAIGEDTDDDGHTLVTITWKLEGDDAPKGAVKGRLSIIEFPVGTENWTGLTEAAAYLLSSDTDNQVREDIEFKGCEAIRLDMLPDPNKAQINFTDVILQKGETIYVINQIANLDIEPDEAAFVENWLDTFQWEDEA